MMNRIPAAHFAEFLKERMGEGCIAGAQGERAGILGDWYFYGQYAGAELKAALAWKERNARVWCGTGLAAFFVRENGGQPGPIRPEAAFHSWCGIRGFGSIPARCRLPGAALFRGLREAERIGYLLEPVDAAVPAGDWFVVEANDLFRGVTLSLLSEGGWNMWGLMTRLFTYPAFEEPVELPLGGRVLKDGALGRDVYQLQLLMNRLGWTTAQDGCFSCSTAAALRRMQAALDLRCDGEYGPCTHAALMARLDGGSGCLRSGRLAISADECFARLLPCKGAAPVGILFRGMEAEWIGQCLDWKCVLLNGAPAWVPADSCEVKENG